MPKPALGLPARATLTVPALIAGAGDRAALRFLEFFAVNIRNRPETAAPLDRGLPHERRAYRGRATHGRALEREDHGPLLSAQ
jgi:hypothetical protein